MKNVGCCKCALKSNGIVFYEIKSFVILLVTRVNFVSDAFKSKCNPETSNKENMEQTIKGKYILNYLWLSKI